MKGLIVYGPEDIRYEELDNPKLSDPGDVIVKMTQCAICGSDLHFYHGMQLSPISKPFPVGHEAIGEVIEVGRDVRKLKAGDKVMLLATIGCGACRFCLAGLANKCERYGGARTYGLGLDLGGCQSEMILVPAGDFNALPIPEGVTSEQALMCVDNLPTAYLGCVNADIRPGKTVAVIGLGPIGLITVECAFLMGASRVFALDLVPERRAMGAKLGAIVLDPGTAVEAIREATDGRMLDCAVEVVGISATTAKAIELVGQQGTVSVIGAGLKEFMFPMMTAFLKGLTFRVSLCSVAQYLPELISLLQSGRLHPERFFSHRMKLSEGPKAYDMFDRRLDGVMKIVLNP
jgi:2-desacetyl-2-hydroxyethyl bacteriochlorophyllide A dehydrogenase